MPANSRHDCPPEGVLEDLEVSNRELFASMLRECPACRGRHARNQEQRQLLQMLVGCDSAQVPDLWHHLRRRLDLESGG